jgi:hypothetical protein
MATALWFYFSTSVVLTHAQNNISLMICNNCRKYFCFNKPKLGIRNLSPLLRNSPILRTTKSIAEFRTKKNCGTAIADLQKLTSAITQLSAGSCQFRYILVPFPQLMMVLKINQKYF